MEKSSELILISVGGSQRPIVYSIIHNRPERLIFFVSPQSYMSVTSGILPAVMQELGFIPPHEIVVTPDAENIGESVYSLLTGVPEALKKLGSGDIAWPKLIDYTGGTKSMSAAMVWASSGFPCQFSYIGADTPETRSKGGLGIVIDGCERCFIRENPWDKIGYYQARKALDIFNQGRYNSAADEMDSLCERVADKSLKHAFALLSKLFHGFACWDIFNHQGARQHINESSVSNLGAISENCGFLPSLKEFWNTTTECLEILRGITPGKLNRNLVWDLLANAKRRGELENKYEDACARCYSTIEKWGKYILQRDHAIKNNDARPEQLPDSLRDEYVTRFSIEKRNPDKTIAREIKFGLLATYHLLEELGNPLGKLFHLKEEAITTHLASRNSSILAHGTTPATKEDYSNLFQDALYLLECRAEDLAAFPHFAL